MLDSQWGVQHIWTRFGNELVFQHAIEARYAIRVAAGICTMLEMAYILILHNCGIPQTDRTFYADSHSIMNKWCMC